MGARPVQLPLLALSVLPSFGIPEIAGSETFTGAPVPAQAWALGSTAPSTTTASTSRAARSRPQLDAAAARGEYARFLRPASALLIATPPDHSPSPCGTAPPRY